MALQVRSKQYGRPSLTGFDDTERLTVIMLKSEMNFTKLAKSVDESLVPLLPPHQCLRIAACPCATVWRCHRNSTMTKSS